MTIFELTSLLSDAKAKFKVEDVEDGLKYVVSVPFERWEIEIRSGQVVKIERFISTRDRIEIGRISDLLDKIGMK